jgi:glycosyltransferase involved in cell wall biosynthesis
MKILFDHPNPFLLAHGGFQIQIEQTKAGLESAGVDVEHLRWWDDRQRGDIIHYFGRPSSDYIRFAHQKKMKVIIAPLLTGLGSRPPLARFGQKVMMRAFEILLPRLIVNHFNWNSFREADACIAGTSWEARLMAEMFRTNPDKVHVVPNGVEAEFFESSPEERGEWLVCTATITERKRVLELSEAATHARVPLWIIGKAYSDTDFYAQRFFDLARRNPEFIRYEGPISERANMAKVYRQARGFVLLSTMETRSLSAEEAAACQCPLLLSNLPWAKSVFNEKATYCPVIKSISETARHLKNFYNQAAHLPRPEKPKSWREVGLALKSIYQEILNTSR